MRSPIALIAAAAIASIDSAALSSRDPGTWARRHADAERNRRHAETLITAAEAKRAHRAAKWLASKGATP